MCDETLLHASHCKTFNIQSNKLVQKVSNPNHTRDQPIFYNDSETAHIRKYSDNQCDRFFQRQHMKLWFKHAPTQK